MHHAMSGRCFHIQLQDVMKKKVLQLSEKKVQHRFISF